MKNLAQACALFCALELGVSLSAQVVGPGTSTDTAPAATHPDFTMAGTQDIPVTTSSLADWQITGADRAKLQAQETLILPAGAELSRIFKNGSVILYSVSRPQFGASSDDWPILQVGPAALALTRKGVRGEVVVLIGDKVNTLSMEVALDSNGKALQPVELALGYDPATKVGLLAFGDQSLAFTAPADSPALDVAVAAGEKSPWTQDALEVLVIGPDREGDAKKGQDDEEAAKRAALLQSTAEKLKQAGANVGGAAGAGTAGAKSEEPAKAVSTLEIFTPPSVRHSPAAVRAAIAKASSPSRKP